MSRIQKLAKHFASKPDVANQMLVAHIKDVHECAIVIAAQYLATGAFEAFPAGSVLDKAQKLSHKLLLRENEALDPQGSTPSGMVTDYDITPPSDVARGQMAEERKKNGSGEYRGARVIWPDRNRVGRYNQEWAYSKFAPK